MRLIKSNYAGTCYVCGKRYAIGDSIYWNPKGTRGKKAAHRGCVLQPEIPSQTQENHSPATQVTAPVPAEKPTGEIDVFNVDWNTLKETMVKCTQGQKPAIRPHNASLFDRWLNHPSRDWTGFSAEDIKRWLSHGYKLDGLNFDNPPIPIREKRRLIFTDDGDEFHLDRALSGEDTFTSEWTKRDVIPGLAIEAEIGLSSATSSTVMTAYFQFLCRAIYALEQAGVDLQVTLNLTCCELFGRSSNKVYSTKLRVKRENEATDFSAWSAMLSPAAMRAYGFCAQTLHADNSQQDCPSYMGMYRVPFLKEWAVDWDAKEARIHIRAVQHNATEFPAEYMENQLREALAAMHTAA
jgi:hypothetical protein